MDSESIKKLEELTIGMYYKLVDGKPVACTFIEYAERMEKEGNNVKKTEIEDVLISTIFLGIKTDLFNNKPQLFETMIFGGKYDMSKWKTDTMIKALKLHEQACRMVKRGDDDGVFLI